LEPEIRVLENPKIAKVLASETRVKIIKEISREPKSLSQLARIFKISPAAVYYHVKQLEKIKFVKIVRTEVVNNNLTEKYYQAAIPSATMCLSFDTPVKGPVPPKKQTSKHILAVDLTGLSDALNSMGLKCPTEKEDQLEKSLTKLLEIIGQEAETNYAKILNQLNLKLSTIDRLKIESSIRALISLTLLRVADKPAFLETAHSIVHMVEAK
jgi:DNA-binding transcriptional ArsR family regulator